MTQEARIPFYQAFDVLSMYHQRGIQFVTGRRVIVVRVAASSKTFQANCSIEYVFLWCSRVETYVLKGCLPSVVVIAVKEFAEACSRVVGSATGRQLLQVQLEIQQKLCAVEQCLRSLTRQKNIRHSYSTTSKLDSS